MWTCKPLLNSQYRKCLKYTVWTCKPLLNSQYPIHQLDLGKLSQVLFFKAQVHVSLHELYFLSTSTC